MTQEHLVLKDTIQFVLEQLNKSGVASFPPIEELLDPLSTYWQLLQRWNAKIKLTGAKTCEDYAQRHVADSFFGWWGLHDRPAGQSYLDIGAGAGFPSIPLALLRSDLSWTLVESHSRRAAFLQQVKRHLKLDWLQTKATRITGHPARERLEPPYHGIVFRAVAPEQILPIAHHYLAPNGTVIYWGTPDFQPPALETMRLMDTLPYKLPGGEEFQLFRFQTVD